MNSTHANRHCDHAPATQDRRGRIRTILLGLLALVLLSTGCRHVPVFFLKTGASGRVMDQSNKPVPNARMLATWRPHDLGILHAKRYKQHFNADANGYWEFSARNASDLCIEVLPSPGYKTISVEHSLYGPVRTGCHTVVRRPLKLMRSK